MIPNLGPEKPERCSIETGNWFVAEAELGDKDQQFSLGQVKFKMSIKSPSGDADKAPEYMRLEFRREVSAGDKNPELNIYEF